MEYRKIILPLLLLSTLVSASAQELNRIEKIPNAAFGINAMKGDSVSSSYMNIGLLTNTMSLHGLQTGVIGSIVRDNSCGLNVGGMMAYTHNKMAGLQVSGFINTVRGVSKGVQIAGVSNMARSMNGAQIGGFCNISLKPFSGLQLSGITNISLGVKGGVQISAIANISAARMRGWQLSTYNFADTLSGFQLGAINVCVSDARGVQVGIVNYSRGTVSRKIGLVNITPETKTDFMSFAGTSSKINIGMRFRNKSTYNIIGVGTHYMGFDERFSGTLFYRLGKYTDLSPRWSISGDIGYYHIETFVKHSNDKPERLFSLQARFNTDFRINRILGVFASIGYGDTHYYYHWKKYRNRFLAEAGLTIRYEWNTKKKSL